MVRSIIFFLTLIITTLSQECNQRSTDSGLVCVCNSSYCDAIPPLRPLKSGTYQIYTTKKVKLGLELNTGTFDTTPRGHVLKTLTIDASKTYQTIIGFGGCFTDATGINIAALPEDAQDKLLESYWGDTGASYSIGRVPIGATDFGTRAYSYDDHEGDVGLEKFALQEEDLKYKIPFITQAKALRGNGEFKLFGSAWTAPQWMKTKHRWDGGRLKEEHYQTWTNYLIKFLDSYAEKGVEFWGMTTGNEPSNAFLPSLYYMPTMGWLPTALNKWIGENFGPTIRNSSYKDLKIILFDDNRHVILEVPWLLHNELTLQYADGVGVHWYFDQIVPWRMLHWVKTDKKNIFLLMTEATNGMWYEPYLGSPTVDLGSWNRGMKYVDSILNYMEHEAAGWTDWNMVLDLDGGPPLSPENRNDAPIIVNATAGEFYKQPMYYALAHFSKFVVPGSMKIESKLDGIFGYERKLKAVAFKRPDNATVVFIYNSHYDDVKLNVVDADSVATLYVSANSINTLIY